MKTIYFQGYSINSVSPVATINSVAVADLQGRVDVPNDVPVVVHSVDIPNDTVSYCSSTAIVYVAGSNLKQAGLDGFFFSCSVLAPIILIIIFKKATSFGGGI